MTSEQSVHAEKRMSFSTLRMYCVWDSKANASLMPFFAPTDAVAVREMASYVQRPDHMFNKFPEDYCLFRVGKFDQATMESTGEPADAVTQLVLLREEKV